MAKQMNDPTRILIELRHLDFGEISCGRCTDTGTNLLNVISELGQEHLLDDVEIEVKNTILPPNRANESNVVLINGIPLEKIIDERIDVTECGVCSDCSGEPNLYRDRDIFTAIPEKTLHEAILKVLKRD